MFGEFYCNVFDSQNLLTSRYFSHLAIISDLFGEGFGEYTHFQKRRSWQSCIRKLPAAYTLWTMMDPDTLAIDKDLNSDGFFIPQRRYLVFRLKPTASISFSLLLLFFLWNFRYVAFLAFSKEIPLLQTASRSHCL